MFLNLNEMTINTALVETIERASGDRLAITFASGRKVYVAASGFDLETCEGTIVPAPPEYRVIQGLPPEPGEPGEVDYLFQPIIAFRVVPGSDAANPITDDGEPTSNYAVVRPNGECVDYDRTWPSVEAWKAGFEETIARIRKPAPRAVA